MIQIPITIAVTMITIITAIVLTILMITRVIGLRSNLAIAIASPDLTTILAFVLAAAAIVLILLILCQSWCGQSARQ
jgi:hypothetical protein